MPSCSLLPAEQQEQQGEDATEKRVEGETVEREDEKVVPEVEVKENPTERTDGGECTAAELVSVSAATGKWSVKSNKCIPTSCVDGMFYVLKNNVPDGWCIKNCTGLQDYEGTEGSWSPGGKSCNLTPKQSTAKIKTEHEQAPAGDFTTNQQQSKAKSSTPQTECGRRVRKNIISQTDCKTHCTYIYAYSNNCQLNSAKPYYWNAQTNECICNPTNEDFNYQQLKPQPLKPLPYFDANKTHDAQYQVNPKTQEYLKAVYSFDEKGNIIPGSQNRR